MQKIYIVANKFYSNEKMKINIGGIETYIIELSRALLGLYETIVVQPGCKEDVIIAGGVSILNIPENSCGRLVKVLEKKYLSDGDVLLFSTEQWACSTLWKRASVIQHGIYWDLPINLYSKNVLVNFFPMAYKFFDAYRNYRRIKSFEKIVCVDYVYKTWYKSLFPIKNKKFNVIVNFSSFASIDDQTLKVDKKVIKITFARRFVDIRGVDLAIECAEKILAKHKNVNFNFIGDGPCGYKIKDKFSNNKNVFVGLSSHENMKNIIEDSDIIFIPSLGSEGTSLIALEAMALGKVVVASDVGGLSNIIINKYNGYLCNPVADEFTEVLDLLVEDKDTRNYIGSNALTIANRVFSKDEWSTKWIKFLNDL